MHAAGHNLDHECGDVRDNKDAANNQGRDERELGGLAKRTLGLLGAILGQSGGRGIGGNVAKFGVNCGDEAAIEHVVEGKEGRGGGDDKDVGSDEWAELEVVGVNGRAHEKADSGGNGASGKTDGPPGTVDVNVVGEGNAEDKVQDAEDDIACDRGLVGQGAVVHVDLTLFLGLLGKGQFKQGGQEKGAMNFAGKHGWMQDAKDDDEECGCMSVECGVWSVGLSVKEYVAKGIWGNERLLFFCFDGCQTFSWMRWNLCVCVYLCYWIKEL